MASAARRVAMATNVRKFAICGYFFVAGWTGGEMSYEHRYGPRNVSVNSSPSEIIGSTLEIAVVGTTWPAWALFKLFR